MFTARKTLLAALLISLLPATTLLARVSILPYPIPPIEPPISPDPPPGYAYRWVEPVYRTVYEKVWIEERTRQVEDWVEIAPGRWERCWRTIIIPAHYETVARRQLVSGGYWELVRIHPYPHPIPMPRPIVSNPPTVSVDGYSQKGGDDLSKFSGLSEWPDKK